VLDVLAMVAPVDTVIVWVPGGRAMGEASAAALGDTDTPAELTVQPPLPPTTLIEPSWVTPVTCTW